MSGKGLFAIPVDTSGESTRLVRWSVFVLLVLFGGMVAWGSVAPISGAVVAGGVIKVDTNRKSVQHFEGGIVREILVREGQEVEAGQPLIILEDTDRSADLNILNDVLHAHLIKETRLIAEASLAESVSFDEVLTAEPSAKTDTLMRNEQALFQAKRRTLLDQIKLIEDEIGHAEDAVKNLQGQIRAAESGMGIIRQQLSAAEKLVEKGAIDRNSLLELQRKLSDQNEALWSQKSDLSVRRQSVAALRLRIVNLRNDYSKTAEDELKGAREKIFETEERLRPVVDALQRKTIRAVIAGQLINLQVTTVGGVIRPGETIAEIVPTLRDLIFEVKISPRDTDGVYVGQAVKLEISAFNMRSTPLIDGELVYISGDALVDEGSGDNTPFFLGHVRSDPASLSLLGDRTLTPGMPVVAYVQTEPRTFFEYVLSPITSQLRRALVDSLD